jgi:recombination protein RecA
MKTKNGKKPDIQKAESRDKVLELTLNQIKKRCGPGAIMRLGANYSADIPSISTGSLSLDLALGVGGVPRGRVIEIFGPESSGKTTLALHIIANAQKNHGIAAFIDAEHALDPSYARKLGVNLEKLLIAQPDYGEQALEITEMLVASNAVDVVVIDSVAALVPKAELEGNMGDAHVGLQARLMSQALRKLTAVISRSRTCVIFINQIREKIGVMFGNPETTTGGRALKFYSSVRIDIRRKGSIKSGDAHIGNRTRVRVVKNKVAPPFRSAEFDILYARGISWVGDVLDNAVSLGVIAKKGAWYSFGKDHIGQGRDQAVAFMEQNPDIFLDVQNEVLAKLFPEKGDQNEDGIREPEKEALAKSKKS